MLAKTHSINLKEITKADALRFITHVQNVQPVKYDELKNLDNNALHYCKTELENTLQSALLYLPEKTSFQLTL